MPDVTDRAGQYPDRVDNDPGHGLQSWLGRTLVVTVGQVAHGGHCVARFDGRVVFVRHCLPGERVQVLITEDAGGSFCRGDAVDILDRSAQRVAPPCPAAHPGGCGGCDFQHATLAEQRRLKAVVITEQLSRLAGLDRSVEVEALPGTEVSGLGWRRRIRFAVRPDGGLGLRAHRSHEIIELDACPLGAPGVASAPSTDDDWSGRSEVEVAVDDEGQLATTTYSEVAAVPHRRSSARRRSDRGPRRSTGKPRLRAELAGGPPELHYQAGGHRFTVAAGGFWQTHPDAAQTYLAAVLAATAPQPGERALDLYAGAGLFTAGLADAVAVGGAPGRVVALEADGDAAEHARRNLADLPAAQIRRDSVSATTIQAAIGQLDGLDVVVLDPPRTGAGRDVMTALAGSGARVLCYVACDPAALARDIRTATDLGWELTGLVAFDAFPMTHHVECVATLRPVR